MNMRGSYNSVCFFNEAIFRYMPPATANGRRTMAFKQLVKVVGNVGHLSCEWSRTIATGEPSECERVVGFVERGRGSESTGVEFVSGVWTSQAAVKGDVVQFAWCRPGKCAARNNTVWSEMCMVFRGASGRHGFLSRCIPIRQNY